jgi:DNA processing protein
MTILSPRERVDWWRLSRTENIGPITFFRLIERYGTAARALDTLPDLARRGGRKMPFAAFEQTRAEDEIATLEKIGAQVIAACEPSYPPPAKTD